MGIDCSKIKVYTIKEKTENRTLINKINRIMDSPRDFSSVMMVVDGKEMRMAYTKEEADSIGLEYIHYSKLDVYTACFPLYMEFACGWIALVLDWFTAPISINVVTPMGFRELVWKRHKIGESFEHKPYFDVAKIPLYFKRMTGKAVFTKKAMVAGLMACNCDVEQITKYFQHLPVANLRNKIKATMKDKEVIKLATETVKRALEDKGITPEWIIEQMCEAMELSKKTKNSRSLVDAVKEMANWTGFNEKNTKTNVKELEFTNYHEDMKNLTSDTNKVKMVEKKEIDNNNG